LTDWLLPISQKFGASLETLNGAIADWYNGYSWDGVSKVYCPFSFLVFLSRRNFSSFWYETGTPSLITQLFLQQKIDVFSLERCLIGSEAISALNVDRLDTYSLMFQTGYLTIQAIHESFTSTDYTLRYPNLEVRVAFAKSLLEAFSSQDRAVPSSFAVLINRALQRLDFADLFAQVNQVLAGVPYEVFPAKEVLCTA
jgi:hypothetical protein